MRTALKEVFSSE